MAANVFTKAERIVRTALGLLDRETVAARSVWRDAAGDFAGAKNDTITIRLPSYVNANKRGIRSGDAKTKSNVHERSVDVALTDNQYIRIGVTDDQLTLDVDSFEEQIVAPALGGLIRSIEDEVIDEITAAPYPASRVLTLDSTAPHKTVFRARRHLNDSRVPFDGRFLFVGSEVEEILLTSEQLIRVDASGSDSALRSALIGRLANFPVFAVPALSPGEAYAAHQTAYVLNSRAPVVPDGFVGATDVFDGFALRVAQAPDNGEVANDMHADVYTGTNHVLDHGSIDADGFFTPSEDPDNPAAGESAQFVRAVKIEVGS